jgi:hypothetical protein
LRPWVQRVGDVLQYKQGIDVRRLLLALLVFTASHAQGEVLLAGKWGYSSSKDKITDEVSYMLLLDANSKRERLVLTCGRGGVSTLVTSEGAPFALGMQRGEALIRVDQKPPVKEDWFLGAQAASPVGDGKPASSHWLAERLKASKSLVIRLATKTGQRDLEFDTRSGDELIARLEKECRTKPS